MNIDGFLLNNIIEPHRSEIYDALEKQCDFSFKRRFKSRRTMSDNPCNLGAVRREINMKQVTVSQLTKLSQCEISRIENGQYLPSKDDFMQLVNVYKIDPADYAKDVETTILNGNTAIPPAYKLVAEGRDLRDRESLKEIWDLTVVQWRAQRGFPMGFREARCLSGMMLSQVIKISRFSEKTINNIDLLKVDHISAIHLFYFAILYRISPLSLVNAILMDTLWRGNTILGGMPRSRYAGSKDAKPVPNDNFFIEIKELFIALGLIPKWQQPMWNSLMMSLLGETTDLESSVTRYFPFPLTPKNFYEWKQDPILGMFAEMCTPPAGFEAAVKMSMPHDKLESLTVDDYNYFILDPPPESGNWQSFL